MKYTVFPRGKVDRQCCNLEVQLATFPSCALMIKLGNHQLLEEAWQQWPHVKTGHISVQMSRQESRLH